RFGRGNPRKSNAHERGPSQQSCQGPRKPKRIDQTISGRRDEAGQAVAKELQSVEAEAEFINADVRKEDDVRALVDKTVARFGRLDNAVNNAATEGDRGLITAQTAKSFAATFDTNVLRVVLSMKHEVRAMQALIGRSKFRGPTTPSRSNPTRRASWSPSAARSSPI